MNKMTEEQIKEAHELIDDMEWTIDALDKFSVYNDDIFNGEVARMREEVKNCRKQLI